MTWKPDLRTALVLAVVFALGFLAAQAMPHAEAVRTATPALEGSTAVAGVAGPEAQFCYTVDGKAYLVVIRDGSVYYYKAPPEAGSNGLYTHIK